MASEQLPAQVAPQTMEPPESPVGQARQAVSLGKNTSSPLAAVCHHLNRSMAHIQEQLELISQQLQSVSMDDCDHVDGSVDDVDAEITRYREILQRMDELELDFDRMKNIREIARALQRRAERTDRVKDGSLYHGRALRQRTARRHRLVPGVRHMRASQRPGSVGGAQQDLGAQIPAEEHYKTKNPLEELPSWNDTTTLRGLQPLSYPVSGNEDNFLVRAADGPDQFKPVPDASIENHFWHANDELRAGGPPQLYGDPKNLFLGHEDLREAVALALYRETGDGYAENPVFPIHMTNQNAMDVGSWPEATTMETDSVPTTDMGFLPNHAPLLDSQQSVDAIHLDTEAPLDRKVESGYEPAPDSESRHPTHEQNKMDVQYITSNDTSQFAAHPTTQPDQRPSDNDYHPANENGGMNLVEKIALWQNTMADC